HHGVVRHLGAVPPPVPVHAEIAAGERGDVHLAPRDPPHVLQQGPNDLRAEGRCGVAAIEEAMDGDGRNPVADAELDTREQVAVERVNAPRTEQTHEMKSAARGPELGTQLHQGWKLVELAGLDALGDSDEVLRYDPAGPEVQMAHFAVTHLPFGEAHRQ